MKSGFEYFAVISMMRSGSNALAQMLGQIPRLACYGEIFNAALDPETDFPIDPIQDPMAALSWIKDQKNDRGTLSGFRLFPEHDQRVLHHVLGDPTCAKILLTRNPVDQFLSLELARHTDQWQITDSSQKQDAQVAIDADALRDFIRQSTSAWSDIQKQLLHHGQSALILDFADLHENKTLAGIAQFLNADMPDPAPKPKFKPQNPVSAMEKVTTPKTLKRALEGLEAFALQRPTGQSYVGPQCDIEIWHEPKTGTKVLNIGHFGHTTKDAALKAISRANTAPFTGGTIALLADPLSYAHNAFVGCILGLDLLHYPNIKARLVKNHGLNLPAAHMMEDYTLEYHRYNFYRFLQFLSKNLVGQTAIAIKPEWALQSQKLHNMTKHSVAQLVCTWTEFTRIFPAPQKEQEDRTPFDRYAFKFGVRDVVQYQERAMITYRADMESISFLNAYPVV